MSEIDLKLQESRGGGPEANLKQHGDPIPKVPIYLAMGVVVFSLIFVTAARLIGVESWEIENGETVASRAVIWTLNEDDQSITVSDATSGVALETVHPKDGGFIHSAYRGIARERLVKKIQMDAPLTIIKSANGRHTLFDEASDERIYLRAFGKDNEASIAKYLTLETSQKGAN